MSTKELAADELGSLVFNNSENGLFGPANALNPPVEPLKTPNPADVVSFCTVDDGDNAGAKTDISLPRAEGDPTVSVLKGIA